MTERIVGRDSELELLRRALDDTARGTGGCHVMLGPPGIGKSKLLRAAGDYAFEHDIAVAAREAFRHDMAAPLVTLAGALQACSPPAADFAWMAEADVGDAGNYARIYRLRESLERYAAQRPLLIVIDDAHWMDELSALAIRELVPALASAPVRWLLAGRSKQTDAAGWQTLHWLAERSAPILLDVLDDDATERLCAEVLGAEVDATVLAMVSGCGGNPLRIEQLLTALRATEQIVIADGTATVVGDDLPSSFVTTVRDIMGALSDQAQWLLKATSVLDRPFDIETAARLMGSEPADLFDLVDETIASGILVEDKDGMTFRHDLVHQAVRNTLGAARAQHLHAEAAALAREHGRPAGEIAAHLLHSGRRGAAAAVEMLRGNAATVATSAPGAAADLMLQALHAVDEAEPGRTEMIADTVGLLASAARVTQAQKLGEQALEAGLEPRTKASLQLGLAEASKHAGQNRRAAEYAEDGLSQPAIPAPVRARLHAIHAHATFYLDDFATADRAGAEAMRIGREHEPGAAVFGLTARSLVAQAEGRLSDAYGHAATATELADGHADMALHRHPRIWLANALTSLDRFDEAEKALRRGRQEAQALGTAWAQPLLHYYAAQLLIARGRLDDAAAEADAGVALAEQLTAYQLTVPLLGTLIRLAVLRGDPAQAAEHRDRMTGLIATGITAPLEDVEWPLAVLLAAEGDPGRAVGLIAGLYDRLDDRPTLIAQNPAATPALVRLALTVGDRERATRVTGAAARLAARNPSSHTLAGAAAHAAGLLRREPARLHLAIAQFRKTDRPLALATALQDAAAQTRQADRAGAREYYDEANELLARAGAAGSQQRLIAELGGWRGTPAAPPEPVAERRPSPLDRLSPAERQVALLIATGMTNIAAARQLHLSPHTVDSHLRKVFHKLQIHSRVELAGVVTREGAT
ncbi:helix-turn-helix transcriptional regulator [Paractinoplanes abujensis]|uniref:DNA-binding NarL/FixJ family response regulator n=1 Tax=Paractinoplanes abujensis TaxID=882441 RepID=A0A7W7FZE3_9ACTN|nr:AAA family ATPase [Actinoplanes abujensis]MBB4691973.1 DNA-binding NarL/FixJ family response regulator [Actinoplanes abujensis]GID16609.1 helix-turn-helix transcriptional regulator [Actinoplanes abujensis]